MHFRKTPVRYNPREMIGEAPKKKTPLGRESKYRNKVQYSPTSFPDAARRWTEAKIKQLKDEDLNNYANSLMSENLSGTAITSAVETLRELAEQSTGPYPVVEMLIDSLRDDNAIVREGVAFALGWIGDELAVEPLIQALGDEDNKVRGCAAWALVEISDNRAVEPLIKAFEDDEKVAYRVAKEALKRLKIVDLQKTTELLRRLRKERDVAEKHTQKILQEIGVKL